MYRQSDLLIGANHVTQSNLLVERLLDIACSNLTTCFRTEYVLVGVIVIRTPRIVRLRPWKAPLISGQEALIFSPKALLKHNGPY